MVSQPPAHKFFTFSAILISLLLVFYTGRNLFHHTFSWVPWRNADEIKAKIDDKTRQIAEKTANLVNPGPEPDWLWSPAKYYFDWLPKKRIYDSGREKIESLKQDRKDLEDQLNRDGWTYVKCTVHFIWFDLLKPVFDLLLLLAALSFSLRVYLRYLLMRGKLGVARV